MSRVLVHLSDLHFGRTDPRLVENLAATVVDLAPDVVVISGDLTQRARREEFHAAREFLERLPFPQIVVPGNHDVPLYNLYKRFVRRLHRFQTLITEDLEPAYIDAEVAVFGLNTARWFTWKGGALNPGQIARLRTRLCGVASRIKVVATHHPFDLPQGFPDSDVFRAAHHALEQLLECGADLLLCGHLHVGYAGTTIRRYHMLNRAAMVVHAGSATSTRTRGAENSFNVLRMSGHRVAIQEWHWSLAEAAFRKLRTSCFERTAAGWMPQNAALPNSLASR